MELVDGHVEVAIWAIAEAVRPEYTLVIPR